MLDPHVPQCSASVALSFNCVISAVRKKGRWAFGSMVGSARCAFSRGSLCILRTILRSRVIHPQYFGRCAVRKTSIGCCQTHDIGEKWIKIIISYFVFRGLQIAIDMGICKVINNYFASQRKSKEAKELSLMAAALNLSFVTSILSSVIKNQLCFNRMKRWPSPNQIYRSKRFWVLLVGFWGKIVGLQIETVKFQGNTVKFKVKIAKFHVEIAKFYGK